MKKLFLFFLCCSVFFAACKKSETDEIEKPDTDETEEVEDPINASKFIEENRESVKKSFSLTTSELPKTVNLGKGVTVTIPANGLRKNGTLISGNFTVETYLMMSPSDIILAGTNTNYKSRNGNGNGYLISDGFLFIDIKQNGVSIDQYLDGYLTISIPTEKDAGTQVWEGLEQDSALVWTDLNLEEEKIWNWANNQDAGFVNVSTGSYTFDFGKLGWVNCDVLWRPGPLTTVKVVLTGKTGTLASYMAGDGDTYVFFAGKEFNVIAQLYTRINATTVQSYDDSMPIGAPGKMIAFSIKEDGECSFASQDITAITANMNITLNLETISKEALETAIKALDQQ
jgi:hypothetical protein